MAEIVYTVDAKCTIDRPAIPAVYFNAITTGAAAPAVVPPIKAYIWGPVHGATERAFLQANGVVLSK